MIHLIYERSRRTDDEEVFSQRKAKLIDADMGPKQHNVLAELKF